MTTYLGKTCSFGELCFVFRERPSVLCECARFLLGLRVGFDCISSCTLLYFLLFIKASPQLVCLGLGIYKPWHFLQKGNITHKPKLKRWHHCLRHIVSARFFRLRRTTFIANNLHLNRTPHYTASDLGLHCLHSSLV